MSPKDLALLASTSATLPGSDQSRLCMATHPLDPLTLQVVGALQSDLALLASRSAALPGSDQSRLCMAAHPLDPLTLQVVGALQSDLALLASTSAALSGAVQVAQQATGQSQSQLEGYAQQVAQAVTAVNQQAQPIVAGWGGSYLWERGESVGPEV